MRASPVDRILVVLGHRSAEVAASLEGSGAETVFNPRYAEGMLASVQVGVAAAPPDTAWLVIALGDQPTIRPGTVALLLEAAEGPARPGMVVPSHGNRRGHPLLIHARYREEIALLPPERGLRELMAQHPGDVLHVPAPEDVLHDLDTPEDYRRALERLERET